MCVAIEKNRNFDDVSTQFNKSCHVIEPVMTALSCCIKLREQNWTVQNTETKVMDMAMLFSDFIHPMT